jgi:uncharacterized protein (DUF362 family)/Pyruvate/2-oxoacid:ferredoxin oxidoreductase delta subunit
MMLLLRLHCQTQFLDDICSLRRKNAGFKKVLNIMNSQPNQPPVSSIVAIIQCDSYDSEEVYRAVQRGFDLLGGAQKFFTPGEKILLKPNVLAGNPPGQCVTTHPSVFEAVIRVLKPLGLLLSYGDSPAITSPEKAMKKCGLSPVAQTYEIPLADFENGVRIFHPAALIKNSFLLARGITEADGVVNLPKFKTHGLTRVTGAVKNLFGCVPGLTKAKTHAQFPLVNDFCSFLVDINTFVKPRLQIMDAVFAMEGNGPQSGKPKKLGCILMSTDPVALDATICRIVDVNPEFIPTCKIGRRAGLGTMRSDSIKLVGDAIELFTNATFDVVRHPPLFTRGKGFFRGITNTLVPKPVINAALCIACGKCVDICPVEPKALAWKMPPSGKRPPVYTYSRCIRCFCCQETCPQKAISIRRHVLSVILPGMVLVGMGVGVISNLPKKYFKKILK